MNNVLNIIKKKQTNPMCFRNINSTIDCYVCGVLWT